MRVAGRPACLLVERRDLSHRQSPRRHVANGCPPGHTGRNRAVGQSSGRREGLVYGDCLQMFERRRRFVVPHCVVEASATVEDTPSSNAGQRSGEEPSSSTSSSSSSSPQSSGSNVRRTAGGKSGGRTGASSVSSGIRMEGVMKSFKHANVLEDVSWDVKAGERVGLVGYNGSGKTTILRMLTGELEADGGEIIKASEQMKIAYLSQEFEVDESRTVRQEFRSASAEIVEVLDNIERVQRQLETTTEDMDLMGKLLDDLDTLQKRADALDTKKLDSNIDKMMPKLGFVPTDNDRPVSDFSGGWQMRMSLGKILLQSPDLLLLDEPTNHIDVDTMQWLESYLKEQDVPMVIVSHDRYFLDQLCNKIIEIERGEAFTWKGNYSDYLRQKQERDQAQLMAYNKQQKEMKKQMELVKRLSGTGQSGRAEASKKALDKLKSSGTLVKKPFVEKTKSFRFPELKSNVGDMVIVDNLVHGYGENSLFDDASLTIVQGDRVALVGPNGAGKSTLLRLILDMEKPSENGSIYLGKEDLKVGFFRQNQAEGLDLNLTVFDTLNEVAKDYTVAEVKAVLGQFFFKGDTVEKKVAHLSGGEKARLSLAKFMLTPWELLILDEPTNHLDIPSKEMMERALCSFGGSVIAVSHDRFFLRKIASRVVEVKDRKLDDYQGDYDYYISQNSSEALMDADRKKNVRTQELKSVKAKSKMSKAERAARKKEKAKQFQNGGGKKKGNKNAKRWN